MGLRPYKYFIAGFVSMLIGFFGMIYWNINAKKVLVSNGVLDETIYVVKDSMVTINNGPESKRLYKYSGEVNVRTKLPTGIGEAHFNAIIIEGEEIPACDYRGKFQDGLFEDEGMAILTFDNGATYKGSFSAGFYNSGTLTQNDRTRFEGKFKDGQPFTGTFYTAANTLDGTIVDGVEQ